jgi:hypothetical protein
LVKSNLRHFPHQKQVFPKPKEKGKAIVETKRHLHLKYLKVDTQRENEGSGMEWVTQLNT